MLTIILMMSEERYHIFLLSQLYLTFQFLNVNNCYDLVFNLVIELLTVLADMFDCGVPQPGFTAS